MDGDWHYNIHSAGLRGLKGAKAVCLYQAKYKGVAAHLLKYTLKRVMWDVGQGEARLCHLHQKGPRVKAERRV